MIQLIDDRWASFNAMNLSSCPPPENALLAMLTPVDLADMLAQSERVTLRDGEVLYQPGQPCRDAWFPCAALVSLEYHGGDGSIAELAMVGRDGLVGVPSLLGMEPTHFAVVQSPGVALRIRADALRRRMREDTAMRQVGDGYTHVLLGQIAQTSACKSLHPLVNRLCRWLLVCADRLDAADVRVTQDQLARLLGVRRESVNHATSMLQSTGCVRISRGHVHIVDAARLEESACECLGFIRGAHDGARARKPLRPAARVLRTHFSDV